MLLSENLHVQRHRQPQLYAKRSIRLIDDFDRGVNHMHQADRHKHQAKLTLTARLLRWLHPLDTDADSVIDDIAADPEHEAELRRDSSGGYNEAFVVQYWASYSPRY